MSTIWYPLGISMSQVQSVLLLYGLSGGENWPDVPRKILLHLPGGRVILTGVGVVTGGSLLTDSDDERKPNKNYCTLTVWLLSY